MPEAIHLDFTGVTTTFEPIDPGLYYARIEQIEMKYGQTGKPYFSWTFVLQDEPYEGRKVWFNTSLQPQALWNLKRTLEAMGYTEEDLEGSLDFDSADLVDEVAVLEISQREYQGQLRPQVERVLPHDTTITQMETVIIGEGDVEVVAAEELELPF